MVCATVEVRSIKSHMATVESSGSIGGDNMDTLSDFCGQTSTISEATMTKAMKELHEDPTKRDEQIADLKQRIREWVPKSGGEKVQFSRVDDNKFLLAFLRARKFDVDKALQLYVNYHQFRHKYASVLSSLSASSVEHVLKSGVLSVPDSRFYNGSKAICVYPQKWDYETVPFLDNFRATMLVLDKLIEDEETQVHGISVVYNFEGTSFYSILKVAQLEHSQRAMLIELLQEAFPARFKGVHLINQPWYISIVMGVIKPFMKQKLRDRIHLHGTDYQSLHEHTSPDSLPIDFGGTRPPPRTNSAIKLFQDELQIEVA